MTWLIAKQINLYRENVLMEALCSENFELDVACNMLHTSCRDPCNFVACNIVACNIVASNNVAKKVAPCIPSFSSRWFSCQSVEERWELLEGAGMVIATLETDGECFHDISCYAPT